MKQTKYAYSGKDGKKRMFAWIDEKIHREIKASAAIKGINLELWFVEAAKEKLSREQVDTKVIPIFPGIER